MYLGWQRMNFGTQHQYLYQQIHPNDVLREVIFFRFIYWLMLVERFGPIVINISRVINDIFTLAITYGILLFAFTFGLVFILDDNSNPQSSNE